MTFEKRRNDAPEHIRCSWCSQPIQAGKPYLFVETAGEGALRLHTPACVVTFATKLMSERHS